MADQPTPRKRSPIWLLVKLAIVAVALAAGYKYGFGPLLSAQKQQPSTVYVINATDQAYDASFGWRRLKRSLHPDSFVQFQLYVGMKETQTLQLTPQGGGQPRKVPVELYPGCLLLLNLDGAAPFHGYRPGMVSQAVAALGALRQDLSAKRHPQSLTALAGELRRIGSEASVGPVKQTIVDLTGYQPYIREMEEFSELPTAGEGDRPILTTETLTFKLANGELTWNAATPEKLVLESRLDGPVKVDFGHGIGTTVPAGTPIQLRADADRMSLRFYSTGGAKVTWEGETWDGAWSYEARLKGAAWEWSWSFGGSGKIKGAEWSFGLVIPHTGKPKTTKEKMELPM